jgi:hypothetical protein
MVMATWGAEFLPAAGPRWVPAARDQPAVARDVPAAACFPKHVWLPKHVRLPNA